MGKAANTDARLERIDERLAEVERGVHGIKVTLRVVGSVIGLLLLFIIGVAGFAGKSVMRDVAREVYREEMAYRQTVEHGGKLTVEGRRELVAAGSNDLVSYRWDWQLGQYVNPANVVSVRFQPSRPLPGVTWTADIGGDGMTCTMTLSGRRQVIDSLDYPVEGKAIIETRGTQPET